MLLYSPYGNGYYIDMNWKTFVRKVWCGGVLSASGMLTVVLAALLCLAPALCAARTSDKAGPRRVQASGKHGWTFSTDAAQARRWQKGISGAELQHKAVAGAADRNTAASSVAATRKSSGGTSSAAGTGSSRSGLAVSWERDIATWQVETPSKLRQAGETFSLRERHIVRAQAQAGSDNAFVSIGPEVILKNDDDRALAKDTNSPESAVGFGMRFMLGF